jgi:two-component system response regulator NreC
VTIVVADDHQLVRRAIRMVLEAEPDFEVVGEAGDVRTAVRKVLGYKPSVVVLDLNMPDGSSLDAIPELHEVSPRTAIVVLTMDDEPLIACAAIRAGASAFVPKEAADSELVDATRAASHGQSYLDPQLGGRIATENDEPSGAPDGLSGRELEVLKLLALGLGTRTPRSPTSWCSAFERLRRIARASNARPTRARAPKLSATRANIIWSRHYRVGARLHGLLAGVIGRTLLAGICLAGEWLRLTPRPV